MGGDRKWKTTLSPRGMHCMSCTSGSDPLGQLWWHCPWRKYKSAGHLTHSFLLTHTSQPTGHSGDRGTQTSYNELLFPDIMGKKNDLGDTLNNMQQWQCLTCALSQGRVCRQPSRTALSTFSSEQEVARMTASAEGFTETESAVLSAPCNGVNLG